MSKKVIVLLVFCVLIMASTCVYMMSIDVDPDAVVNDFIGTVNGSYFNKYLRVDVSPAEAEMESVQYGVEADESVGVNVSVALSATPGSIQGLWSDSTGNTISAEDFNTCVRSVYGAQADKYIECLGIAMDASNSAPLEFNVDKFKDKFGYPGLIHYYQGNPAPWAQLNQNIAVGGYSTMGASSCGYTGLSIAFSSMLHRYITPIEIILARDTYDVRHGTSGYLREMRSVGNTGAMVQSSSRVCEFVQDQKYKGQSLFSCTRGELSKELVDATLDAGGFVLLVTHSAGSRTGKWWTGGGHYIVVRDRSGDKYYTADGSHDSSGRPQGNSNNEFTWADLNDSGWKHGHDKPVHYITPGPGYESYITDMSK